MNCKFVYSYHYHIVYFVHHFEKSVNLEPGDMLFYESAKCMHGRPRPFKGKYYSSIFIHYLPVRTELFSRLLCVIHLQPLR